MCARYNSPCAVSGQRCGCHGNSGWGLGGKKMGRGSMEQTVGKGRGEWEAEVWRQMEEGEIQLHFVFLWCPYPTEYFFFPTLSGSCVTRLKNAPECRLRWDRFANCCFKKVEYETFHPNLNAGPRGISTAKGAFIALGNQPATRGLPAHSTTSATCRVLRNKLSKSAVSDGQLLTSPQRLAGSDKVQNELTGKTSFNCLER